MADIATSGLEGAPRSQDAGHRGPGGAAAHARRRRARRNCQNRLGLAAFAIWALGAQTSKVWVVELACFVRMADADADVVQPANCFVIYGWNSSSHSALCPMAAVASCPFEVRPGPTATAPDSDCDLKSLCIGRLGLGALCPNRLLGCGWGSYGDGEQGVLLLILSNT
jgi:hypothetical protein